MADVERAKKQGTREAIEFAWAVMFTVLRDKEGKETEDLRRIWEEVNDVCESYSKGYVTIADLKKVLKDDSKRRFYRKSRSGIVRCQNTL